MRKNEMAENQLEERAFLIETLSSSGWVGRETNSLFDEGWWFDSEAVMDYQNDGIELVIQYCAEDNSIDFSINEGSNGVDFVIKFEDKLKEILDKILEFQDLISLDNYKNYIRRILKICPSTFIVLDDKVVQLTDKKSDTGVAEET